MKKITVTGQDKGTDRQSDVWIMTGYYHRRMERGNIPLIAAAVLPLIHLALLPVIGIVEFAGFVLYELLLIAGVARGTKLYYRMYALPQKDYHYKPHVLQRWIFGLSSACMVLVPLQGISVLLVWAIGIVFSFLVNFFLGRKKHLWRECLIEYASAIRADYFFCLLAAALFFVGKDLLF